MFHEFDPDAFRTLALSGLDPKAALIALGGLAAALLASLLVILPATRAAFDPTRLRERRVEDLTPFRSLLEDGVTLVSDDGRLSQVAAFTGADAGSLRAQQIAALDFQRLGFFNASREFTGAGARRVEYKIFYERTRFYEMEDGRFAADQPFMARVAAKWRTLWSGRFENRFYIIYSVAGRTRGARETLGEFWALIERNLREYGPRRLGGDARAGRSELLAFWSRHLSAGGGYDMAAVAAAPGDPVAKMLGRCEIGFNRPQTGVISFTDGDRTRYMRAVEIRQFPGRWSKNVMLGLLSLPLELRILYQVEMRSAFQMKTEIQGRRMLAGEYLPGVQIDELQEAEEGLQDMAWGEARLTIFVIADGVQELRQAVQRVRGVMSNRFYMETVVVGPGAELLWQAVFPGKAWLKTESMQSAAQMAETGVFFRSDPGYTHSDFGPGPIAVFPTALGELYRFIFHRGPEAEEPGHTMVIGGTSSGKTVLIEFLVGMALRHEKLRAFIFDNLYGCYNFTHACGGRYWSLALGDDVGGPQSARLNPMQVDLTKTANIEFLKLWLADLAQVSGLESRDQRARALEDIADCITSLGDVPKAERSLAYVFNTSFGASVVRDALEQWVDQHQRGHVLNGRRDSLDLSEGRVVSFDMAYMREDLDLMRAVLPYLFHRIRQSVAEHDNPYIAVFEETAHMLRIPELAVRLLEELQQARKRHGLSILAFQEPSAIEAADEATRAAILTNCYTQFFFPNPGADRQAYASFDLKEHEWAFVCGVSESGRSLKHPVLIRKKTKDGGWRSVVVDVDLSGLGAELQLFRSDSSLVALGKRMREQFPEHWRERFCAEAERMSAQNAGGGVGDQFPGPDLERTPTRHEGERV